MDWMQAAVDSLTSALQFAMELMEGDKEAAISYVRERSTAGTKAWELALQKLGMAD
jgi:hypothetical protein